jgi:hypothetical protein
MTRILYNTVMHGHQCPDCGSSQDLRSVIGDTDNIVAKCLHCNTCWRANQLIPIPQKEEKTSGRLLPAVDEVFVPVDPPQEFVDGLLVSTDTLAYHLIPEIAIRRLCERIMLGEKIKGKAAWNALSDNQEVLDSPKALARRFGHTINHAYKLLAKLQNNEPWTEEDEKEASAVMWGGMYAICAIAAQRKKAT